MPLTTAQEQYVREQLRLGVAAYRISVTSGLPAGAVRRLRDSMGIAPVKQGSWLRQYAPEQVLVDEVESDGRGAVDVRIVEPGTAYLERPNQERWMALCASAVRPADTHALRRAMCWVLGLHRDSTEDEITTALIAERRPADELARLYLDARRVA